MDKRIAVLLANGFEEGEALFVVDILRRAGFACDIVSVEAETVQGAHDIRVHADRLLNDIDTMDYDMLVLPGGLPGANTLRDNDKVIAWVKSFSVDERKYIGAICAAPQVLAKAGVVKGRKLTSYPGDKYRNMFADAVYIDDNAQTEECVVVDGHLITSRGPGTTLPFAYKLVEVLGGDADRLRASMQYDVLRKVLSMSY